MGYPAATTGKLNWEHLALICWIHDYGDQLTPEFRKQYQESAQIYVNQVLPNVQPCEQCMYHANKYVKEHPPPKTTGLFKWYNDFRNSVHQRLKKRTWTLEESKQYIHDKYVKVSAEQYDEIISYREGQRADHKRIRELERENEELKRTGGNPLSNKETTVDVGDLSGRLAAVLLCMVAILCILVLILF